MPLQARVEDVCRKVLEDCLKECGEECVKHGLDAECRRAYKDCLANPENYMEQ